MSRSAGRGACDSIPGVGKAIAQKIEEYLRTGKIQAHQDLLEGTPAGLGRAAPDLRPGTKDHLLLHEKLNITNLDELEKAAKEHRIRRLPRMGPTSEKNILKSIERYRKRSNRILLSVAEPIVDEILAYLKGMKVWKTSLQRAATVEAKRLWAISISSPRPPGRRRS